MLTCDLLNLCHLLLPEELQLSAVLRLRLQELLLCLLKLLLLSVLLLLRLQGRCKLSAIIAFPRMYTSSRIPDQENVGPDSGWSYSSASNRKRTRVRGNHVMPR